MLLKLTPDQVVNYWDDIRDLIKESLPPTSDKSDRAMNRLLEALMVGIVDAWISFRKPDKEVVALVTTTVVSDVLSRTRTLLIYTTTTLKQSNAVDWKEGFEALNKYAKKLRCHAVACYTTNPEIRKIAAKFGGEEVQYITFPLH